MKLVMNIGMLENLQIAFKYKEWRKFDGIINKSITACNNSNINANDQFVQVDKLIQHGKGGMKNIKDYKLSRYACYLIVMYGNPSLSLLEFMLK